MPISVPDRTRLAEYLPIAGCPMIVRHGHSYCLASVLYTETTDDLVLETRLSGDFPSRQAAEAFFASLIDDVLLGYPVWSRILSHCLPAPPLAPTLPPLPPHLQS